MKIFSMLNISRYCKLGVAALLAIGIQSCKKENGIDNNRVITKPYSLYIGDTSGAVFSTNNGKDYLFVGEYTDGFPNRAIVTTGKNIMIVKQNAFVSTDEGLNFNPIMPPPGGKDVTACNPVFYQAMLLNVPSYDNRIYMAAAAGGGVMYSDSNGKQGSWVLEPFEPGTTPGMQVTSFTQTSNGKVYGYDHVNKRLFFKDSKGMAWKPVLPVNNAPAGQFYLSHFINTLVMADVTGAGGVWFSVDGGQNWTAYTGIPASAGRIFAVEEAYGQSLLVATEFGGLYRLPLSSTVFQTANNGFDQNAIIRGITTQYDYYKNEQTLQYIYAATSKGIYRSQDMGENWIRVREGNYTAIY